MEERDNVRPPRRKRIQNGGGAVKNGHYHADYNGAVNGSPKNGDDNVAYKATNGKAKSKRRQRIEARRKNMSHLLTRGIYIAGFFLFIVMVMMWSGPSISNSPTSQNGPSTSNNVSNNVDTSEKVNERVLSKIPNTDSPLTEKQEQEILMAAHEELNQFPISIGTDEWETIQHPGTEVMEFFTGDGSRKLKKRATASELAGVLSGKKLRGGSNNENESNGGNNNSNEEEKEGYMRVPKFWDPVPYRTIADERDRRSGVTPSDISPFDGVRRYLGNFGSRLMTPAEAKSIGSRVPSSSGNNGEMLETIFVAIASYRDWQCPDTVESAFSRASRPERVRVAVVDQFLSGKDAPCSVPPEKCDKYPATCKYQSQIDYFTVDAELSVGPVFARHLGHRLYRGESFAMQSDAHVAFVVGWDNEIIEQWHTAKNEMAILSTYLSGTNDHINLNTGKRTSKSRPIMCESDFEGQGGFKHLRHGQQPEGVPFIHDMPTLNPYWAAGFSFGRGHFVVNIPYDQHLPWIFQGEEISIGLRGFSYGYDFYSPERSVCFHFYGRKNVPMFWENQHIFRGSGVYGMNRLNAIIHMESPSINGETKDWIPTEELKYGIGKVRDLQRFFDIFGIHVKRQTVEKHLCRFVGRPMQKEFIPFLRSNEMGLDYDRITYRFVDK